MYPNPAHNAMFIDLGNLKNEETTIRIADITGKAVIEGQTTGKQIFSIDISKLDKGLYFIFLTSANGIVQKTEKMLVE